jgi:hypothetical protein
VERLKLPGDDAHEKRVEIVLFLITLAGVFLIAWAL